MTLLGGNISIVLTISAAIVIDEEVPIKAVVAKL
jgi:hypothetical protein